MSLQDATPGHRWVQSILHGPPSVLTLLHGDDEHQDLVLISRGNGRLIRLHPILASDLSISVRHTPRISDLCEIPFMADFLDWNQSAPRYV